MSSLSEATLYDWDVERMVIWLREEQLHDCVRPFSLKKINGISFLNLTEFDLKTFQISQESKRKLTKVLKRIKAKKKNRSFSNNPAEIVEPRRPSSIPAHIDLHEDGEIDDWGSDFDSEDEFDQEEDDSGSDGEYIEPEEDESLNKEAPNVPTGLVAQLRAGLSGSFKSPKPPAGQSNPQTAQLEEDEEIYDVPPDEEEFYEQPSDDSGSGVVVRPMDKKKVIRCQSSEPGEYIDFRTPKYVDKEVTAEPYPPPPSRPPKPGQKLIKPLPAARQPTPPTELEIYDEVPEDEQPGCSQVVVESAGGVEVYEPWESDGPGQHETYEITDPNGPQDFYEVPDSQEPETYEVPEQEQPGQETYEVPDQEPAPPARPPPRGTGWNPLKKSPDKGKPALFKKPEEQKQGKPAPPTKPQISAKPSPPPNPALEKNRSSRLYPNSSNTGPCKSPSSTKRQSAVLPAPTPKVFSPPPPQQTTPARKEENNNERKISNEFPKTSSSPRLPLSRGQLPSASEDDAPPPPPRPGPKRGQGMPRASAKPPSISDSNPPVGEPVPTSPLRKTPLPPLPSQPRSQVGQLKNSPWFHGPLDKKIAESALKSFSKEGSFIVRNSSKDPNNYAMSLYFKGNVKHLRMPKTNNKYVLGDSGKVQFDNIEELVKYYKQHQVDLKSGGSTSLTDACPVRL